MRIGTQISASAVREEERRRLARLLEQRLGQSLNLLLAQANAYHAALPSSPGHARQAIHRLAEMAAQALADLHDLTADLNPSDIEDLGLGPALEVLSLRIERCYGLAVNLDLPERPFSIPSHLALAAYRIAQEALHNAGEHAGAGRLGLSLRLERDGLRLTIADDGDGFQPPEPLGALGLGNENEDEDKDKGRRGLADMVERAAEVGGRLEVSSVLGVGTQVRAYLPFALHEEGAADVGGPLVESLTPREREVLARVAAGQTNKQIAAGLGISDRTVQFHLGNVLGKLGVASRTEAAVLALQRGLV